MAPYPIWRFVVPPAPTLGNLGRTCTPTVNNSIIGDPRAQTLLTTSHASVDWIFFAAKSWEVALERYPI